MGHASRQRQFADWNGIQGYEAGSFGTPIATHPIAHGFSYTEFHMYAPSRTSRLGPRSVVSSIFIWTALLSVPLSAACAAFAGEKTACDGLVYKEFGLTRTEYLPCAGEMIAKLDRVGLQVDAMLSGDANARGEARETLHELQSLFNKAGGRRNMVNEEWRDRGLFGLNNKMWMAEDVLEGCLSDLLVKAANAHPGKEGQQMITDHCTHAVKRARDASDAYRYLR